MGEDYTFSLSVDGCSCNWKISQWCYQKETERYFYSRLEEWNDLPLIDSFVATLSHVGVFSSHTEAKIIEKDAKKERMAKTTKLTRAQIQANYRARRDKDPDRRAKYLQIKKDKYKTDLAVGRRKLIGNMGEREMRIQRRTWRRDKRQSRVKEKVQAAALSSLSTPPLSPVDGDQHAPDNSSRVQSTCRTLRRKLREKEQVINHLTNKRKDEQKLLNKYRMRYFRLQKKLRDNKGDTPRTKTKKLLRNFKSNNSKVKRHLTFHFSILEDISKKYKENASYKHKQIIKQRLCNKLISKYRIKTFVQRQLKLTQRIWKENNILSNKETSQLQLKVRSFFLRDDVSRFAAGKKNTVTRKKIKKQRRILCDTLKNLHNNYIREFPDRNVGYSTFCRWKPFWVGAAKKSDRDTCQCKVHENIKFVAAKLKQCGLLQTDNLADLLTSLMCDKTFERCAASMCEECKGRPATFCKVPSVARTTLNQWENQINEHGSKITVKVEKHVSEKELASMLNYQMTKFKLHVFNIRNQYKMYRDLKENITTDEALIHVDFSENFECQYSNEIQSSHFGASHNQATLHTGMIYTKSYAKGFCTISDSRRHDPPAIWAHLKPILLGLKQKHPEVTKLIFFSDGPTTQYRQKLNFFLLSIDPFNLGFQEVNWNFFESSHGKGAPDGIGGVLKRTADSLLKQGKDIPDAITLFNALSNTDTSVELHFVPACEIEKKSAEVDVEAVGLKPVAGTMKLHQVQSFIRGKITCRDLTCRCPTKCTCFNARDVIFVQGERGDISTSAVAPIQRSINLAEGHCCLVEYDSCLYPGQIISANVQEDEYVVKCMKQIGLNKYVWPERADQNIYCQDDIVCVINEPVKSGRRFLSLSNEDWAIVKKSSDYE